MIRIQPTDTVLPGFVFTVAAVTLAIWLFGGADRELVKRVEGMDAPADGVQVEAGERVELIAGDPVVGQGKPSLIEGEWPCFRGVERDSVSSEGPGLLRQWPDSGPPVAWQIELCEGYAGAAISRGRVFILDHDMDAAEDRLLCLSLDDGNLIWSNSYPIELAKNHGITRTVPAIVGDYVVTLGPRLQLACWDFETGACHWIVDLSDDYKTTWPTWYTGQNPLIHDDKLLVAPCGDALLVAMDYRSGEVLWSCDNPRQWRMTHVSVVPMEIDGQMTYLYCGSGGIAGIDGQSGALLWDSTEWPEKFATSPSPVVLPDHRIFLSSGYRSDVGSMLLQVRKNDQSFSVETIAEFDPRKFNAEQQTPIFQDEHLYGVRKRGGGQAVCLDLDGNEVWNSGRDRFGNGPFMFADGLFFAMDDHGLLRMADVSPRGYNRLAEHQIFDDGVDAWGPIAIAGGRMILRDMTRMICLDLSAH